MEFGDYLSVEPLIRKINILVRMVAFLLILPIATVLADRFVLLGLIVFALLLLLLSKINLKSFWRDAKYYIILSFAFFPIFSLIISQGNYLIRISDGIILGTRFVTFISFGMIYALTTNPNEMLQALRKLGIPHRFGILIMIGFRLYPLILQKMTTISEAIKSRGIDTRISILKPSKTIKTINLMVMPFIIATLETGVQLGHTMMCRGYHPYMPITIPQQDHLKLYDFAFLVICLAFFIFAII